MIQTAGIFLLDNPSKIIRIVVMTKPVLNLVGNDGNAFAILANAKRAALKAGWTSEQISEFMTKAKEGDYDNLLCTCMEYFDAE